MAERRVLVIDDDDFFARLVIAKLEKIGIQCDAADSVMQALELIQVTRYPVAVVDYHLTGIMGMEFIPVAKIRNPLVQVIIATADANWDRLKECIHLGATDFHFKTENLDDLIVCVENCLKKTQRWDILQSTYENGEAIEFAAPPEDEGQV